MCRQIPSIFVTLLMILVSASTVFPQTSTDGVWDKISEQALRDYQTARRGQTPWVNPDKFQLFTLNEQALEAKLGQAPHERLDLPQAARPLPARISLPMPGGSYVTFEFVASSVMVPELAVKFPEIKTYLGKQVGNPSVWARFDWTPAGFHAQVLSPGNTWYVDPYYKGETYASYYRRDYHPADKYFECFTEAIEIERSISDRAARSGDNLHEYRLAVACTGEYGQFHGGTVPLALSAIVTTINRVTGIYEYELAIRLVLIGNNDNIVYIDPATDPFTGNNNAYTLIDESQTEIDMTIGNANFDIGHTFSTGAGGLASLGIVCRAGSKAQGVTGSSSPVGDPFDVDLVAHEVGHQFGANHTFNGVNGNCSSGNRNGPTAYEPGSGSTIMAYSGICGADNLQMYSDPIFHSESHDQIINYITAGDGTCASVTSLNNAIPTVDAGPDLTIPINTPFSLIGSGTDADAGDLLNYLWEERDLGPQAALNALDDGQIPLFRVYRKSSTGQRFFPKLDTLVTNTPDDAEKLPQLGREMNFRLTVRDGNGGAESDDTQVTVDAGSGPFRVTFPNDTETFIGGSRMTVTWEAAGTAGLPVNATHVDIYLSTDGGMTYDRITPLAAGTPNDGSDDVVLPNINSGQARVMVKADGNVFFDISDQDFTIVQDGIFREVEKLIAGDGEGAARFGWSVSISGDTVIVGVPYDNDNGVVSGSAYIFSHDHGGTDNWGEVQKLIAGDGAAEEWFGFEVSVSGDTAIVGTPLDDDNGADSGSAYIFSRDHGGADNWGEVKKLVADDGLPHDEFGYSVSISGDMVIIGVAQANAVYLFSRNQGGADNWGEVKKIEAQDGWFGCSVSIDKDTVIVGASQDRDNGDGSGAAYIFSRNQGGVDNWGEVQKLIASDGAFSDHFGQSVSISGETVIIGAYYNDANGFDSGSAYIFSRDHGGADNWGEVKKLTAADGVADDWFGIDVSISGDTAIIGAEYDDDMGNSSGSAYIFSRDQGGMDNWGEVHKLTASDGTPDDYFGRSVSINGNTAIVGARGDNSGSAYIFSVTPFGDELAVDFGINGLWHHDGSWRKLAGWDPDDDLVGWSGGLAVDFGANGLWSHNGSSWQKLASWDADSPGLAGWDNGLAADFGANGLWSHNGASWQKLASWDADSAGLVGWSHGLAVDFGDNGLWSHDGSSWQKLASWDADSAGLVGWSGGLAVDFGVNGLWSHNGASWQKLASWDVDSGGLAGWRNGLAADFGANGLWSHDSASWQKLASWDVDNGGLANWNGGLAVDFGDNGLWSHDGSSWTKLTSRNPERIVGVADGLMVDFDIHGLWKYANSSWTKIAGWDPEYMDDCDLN